MDREQLPAIMERNLQEAEHDARGIRTRGRDRGLPTEFEKTPKRSIKRHLYDPAILGK